MIEKVIQENNICAIKLLSSELRGLLNWCNATTEYLDKFIKAVEKNYMQIDDAKLESCVDKINKFLSINSLSTDYTTVIPLLGQVSLASNDYNSDDYRLPSGMLNANNMNPTTVSKEINRNLLGENINGALKQIPESHYNNLSLIVDHLDSLFAIIGHGITLVGNEQTSLCDLIKSKVAIVTALYAGDTENIVVIQGDFYGIQDYIFTDGRKANKGAAKLLRGRSFMVSLYTELVALKVMEVCGIPATAQVINAAGKFMIVAPKTKSIIDAVSAVKNEVNNWFWTNTFGVNGFGIIYKEENLIQLETGDNFNKFIKSLFADLELEKMHKFIDKLESPVHNVEYSRGVCKYNNYSPAESIDQEGNDASGVSALSKQQIDVGDYLVKYDRIVIADASTSINLDDCTRIVITDFIGYQVAFTKESDITKILTEPAQNQQISRFWDYSIAQSDGGLWNGVARRYINGYVAKVTDITINEHDSTNKYSSIANEDRVNKYQMDTIKPWGYLACDDKKPSQNNTMDFIGQRALAVFKGDVDNLGAIFQQGIQENNITKMIGLSRQINNFFAIYLPYLCATKYPNVYTVFAGGDDFFLVGSWKSIMELANSMAVEFENYVAHNPELHFSAGIVLFNDGTPVKTLAGSAEENLEHAKNSGKNAVNIFNSTCSWNEYGDLLDKSMQIANIKQNLSHGYVYGMLDLCDMAASSKPEDSIWHSYFIYRTHRLYGTNIDTNEDKLSEKLSILLGNNIKEYKNKFKITLMHYLYQQRA